MPSTPPMAPEQITEREIIMRRFDGVNLLVDQAYLGPTYLRRSQNWIPGETFRLTKMPGNVAYEGGNIPTAANVMKLARVYDTSGNRYLYAVVEDSGGSGDQVWVSTNEAAWTQVQLATGGNATFASIGGVYDIEEMNGKLYIGNGVDAIMSVTIGSTAVTLGTITAFTDGSAAPTLTADSGAQFLTGTYAYAWGIYDTTAQQWLERSQTRTFNVSTTGDRAVSFPTPTGFSSNAGVLSSRFQAHLFVAPINLPIEFAHDQNPGGATAAGTVVLRVLTGLSVPLPLRGVARVGNQLRAHRGRLWVSGDQGNLTAVWATDVVVPGLEQAIFNAGLFFPYNARTPRLPNTVTAIGLATTGRDDPDAPIIVTTQNTTWLFFGDILDDPGAAFIQVSRTAGCIESETLVETPHGTFYAGTDTVYCVPPGGGPPVDVGWPIRPAIANIPTSSRHECRALYHKGFYKLAYVPVGQTSPTRQFWLDLRQGIGQIPSWWGPHDRTAVSAWCTGDNDEDETDAGFMAVAGGGVIERIHQTNSFVENGGSVTLVSIMQTGDLDNNRPFDRKIFTRVRVTAFPQADTQIDVGVSVDGGTVGPFDTMVLDGPPGAEWNVDDWNVSDWAQEFIVSEGDSVAPPNRPRGRTAAIQLKHTQNVGVSIRDFELRYLPVPRPVRSLPDDPLS